MPNPSVRSPTSSNNTPPPAELTPQQRAPNQNEFSPRTSLVFSGLTTGAGVVLMGASRAFMNIAANISQPNNTPAKLNNLLLQNCLALLGVGGGLLAFHGANSVRNIWRAMPETSSNHHNNDTVPLVSMDANSSTSLQGVTVERP